MPFKLQPEIFVYSSLSYRYIILFILNGNNLFEDCYRVHSGKIENILFIRFQLRLMYRQCLQNSIVNVYCNWQNYIFQHGQLDIETLIQHIYTYIYIIYCSFVWNFKYAHHSRYCLYIQAYNCNIWCSFFLVILVCTVQYSKNKKKIVLSTFLSMSIFIDLPCNYCILWWSSEESRIKIAIHGKFLKILFVILHFKIG